MMFDAESCDADIDVEFTVYDPGLCSGECAEIYMYNPSKDYEMMAYGYLESGEMSLYSEKGCTGTLLSTYEAMESTFEDMFMNETCVPIKLETADEMGNKEEYMMFSGSGMMELCGAPERNRSEWSDGGHKSDGDMHDHGKDDHGEDDHGETSKKTKKTGKSKKTKSGKKSKSKSSRKSRRSRKSKSSKKGKKS